MAAWSRATALMTMTSPLGADVLIPIGLSAHEAISSPFQFSIEVICQQGTIDPNKLLHEAVCLTVQADGKPVRHFHGIVQSLTAGGGARGRTLGDAYTNYHLTVVPKFWFLGQTIDCRVYENKSTADILKELFDDAGVTDLSGPPSAPSRKYTVQFNESDLNFATRLMEEEGWFYYFEHTASAHTLVIAEDNASFQDIANATLTASGAASATNPTIESFHHTVGTTYGKWTLRDYDPEKPTTDLKKDEPTKLKTGGAAARDAFRWPALTFDNGVVKDRANWEIQAAEAAAALMSGNTRFAGMIVGGAFTVSSKPSSTYDGAYVVRGANHNARDESWINQEAPASYDCQFTCFLKSVPWRQPIVTPRPRMDGIHTALVMGPQSSKGADIKMQDGEEIHTDDLGRVRVRFFWDHRAESTGSNAVWARVVQAWAGDGWGAQFTPRVGTEVAVGFVDGDPDRPMVLGGLYNGISAPLYPSGEKTKVGFRTRSSQGGSKGSNFSEFTIDDKKGSELVFFHAEKDYTTEVENDQTLKVDNCRIVTIKKDETVTIDGKQAITVKGDQSLTVSDGNQTDTVKTGNYTLDVSSGNISIKAAAGTITMEAMTKIVLKVGQNTMTFDQQGIKIEGMQIAVTGQMKTDIKSPMTTVSGDGMLTLKGGIMMLN